METQRIQMSSLVARFGALEERGIEGRPQERARKGAAGCSVFADKDTENLVVRPDPLRGVSVKPISKGSFGQVFDVGQERVLKRENYMRARRLDGPNEAQNTCEANKLQLAPRVFDSFVFSGESSSSGKELFKATVMARLDTTVKEYAAFLMAPTAKGEHPWKREWGALDSALLELTHRLRAARARVCDKDLHSENVMLTHVGAEDPKPVEALIIDWDPAFSATTEHECEEYPAAARGEAMMKTLLATLAEDGVGVTSLLPRTCEAAGYAAGYVADGAWGSH